MQRPVSLVLDRGPTQEPRRTSLGDLYDRMLASAPLRRWIETQPADNWKHVELGPAPDGKRFRLRLVGALYERAALATAKADGTGVSVDVPTERDRAQVFLRRPGTLPAGIAVIDEPEGYTVTEDVNDRVFDSLAAHDYFVTEFALTPELNLVQFSSGNGDGGYPVFVGYDTAGRPTRVVVDFFLLHLDWPGLS